jgi:hypothetical protein
VVRRLRVLVGRPLTAPAVLLAFATVTVAPFLLSHLTGYNQNPRYLAPALPGMAVVAGLGLARGPVPLAAGGALIAVQALWLAAAAVAPAVAIGPGSELRELSWRENRVCDLSPLLAAAPAHGIPRVMGFGGNDAVNHVQIELVFTRAGRFSFVRPFDNPGAAEPDWAQRIDEAAGFDLVLVTDPVPPLVPARRRAVPPRNLHALGYVARLDADARFRRLDLAGNDCPMAAFATVPAPEQGRPVLSAGGISLRAINVAP